MNVFICYISISLLFVTHLIIQPVNLFFADTINYIGIRLNKNGCLRNICFK